VIKSHQLFGRNSGFTIIEIFVIIAIVFILAAVIFPRYVDYDNQMRLVTIKQNMKMVQIAADAYAANNNGDYPIQPDDAGFKSYFPGGNCNRQKPQDGNYPENPFTHKQEAPMLGNVTDAKQARQLPPVNLGGSRVAGKIFYNAIIPGGQGKATGYAIEGADGNGIALADKIPNTTYILSNP
jgi:type II secretory pathway pseudopilin PulG